MGAIKNLVFRMNKGGVIPPTGNSIKFSTSKVGSLFMQSIATYALDGFTLDITGDILPFSTTYPTSIFTDTLDLSGNTGIVDVDVVQTIDQDVLGIYIFQITSQNLKTLDITAATNMERLNPFSNELTVLDISNNTLINELLVRFNQLTDLDISNNPLIDNLDAQGNLLTSTALDNIFINLDNFGLTNGVLWVDIGRTSASNIAKSNLLSKGWTIDET